MNQSDLGIEIPQPFRSNHLYYGDNLTIMKNIPTGSVDLIYLDPPFNSQRNYNLIYQLASQCRNRKRRSVTPGRWTPRRKRWCVGCPCCKGWGRHTDSGLHLDRQL